MTGIVLEHIRKSYGSVVAVEDVSLTVAPGQLVTLLGPSGSGKTTTLRMIAGLEQPDSGVIKIGDRYQALSENLEIVRSAIRAVGGLS